MPPYHAFMLILALIAQILDFYEIFCTFLFCILIIFFNYFPWLSSMESCVAE